MITLEGLGFGTDVVYARATLLGDDDGRPTLDPDLLTYAARIVRYGEETQEIIVVAPDAATALVMPMPEGLTLGGVIAEEPVTARARIPVVTGVVDARKQIGEGSLIVLDSRRGRVLVDPTAEEIARLQNERQRARFRLGGENVPAQTQSGRTIAVWAMVSTQGDVTEALHVGADGILITAGGDLLPESSSDEGDILAGLLKAAEAFGNGDIALDAGGEGFGALDPVLVCRLAPHCRLRWLLHPDSLPLPVRDLRQELQTIINAERRDDRIADIPLLMAAHPILSGESATPDRSDYSEILIAPDALSGLDFLEMVELPPLYTLLPFDLEDLPAAIQNGITGAIVPLALVAEAKDLIREQ